MLDKRDLSLAFALHMLVVIAMLWANQWQTNKAEPVPERTIRINMVSLQELEAMMPKPKVEPVVEEIVVKEDVKPAAKPVSKLNKPEKAKVKSKPVKVKKAVAKKIVKVEEDPDFDPFAPLVSRKNKPRTKKISGKEALDAMLSQQLSDEELAKYVAGMQQAVERKWKVSTEMIGKVKAALVELELFKNGKVKSVRIVESSGSKQLDASLTQAIYAAAPFSIPDQQFALFKSNTIRFFPLQ